MRLSLRRAEVEVIVEGDNGQEKKWRMVELLGSERNRYLNKLTSRVKVTNDGKACGIKSFDGFQSDLLCICLYNEDNRLLTKEEVEALPSLTQQSLFVRAQKISGLDDKAGSAEGIEGNV